MKKTKYIYSQMKDINTVIKNAVDYYEEKLKKYGPTSQGVNWNSKESQELRFKQLIKVLDINDELFSILDYGCGYGALLGYLDENFQDYDYKGYDSSKAMIEQAKKLYPDSKWIFNIDDLERVDFLIASGIFNVKMNYSDTDWTQYVLETLKQFNELSSKGFSFNILTKYSDKEYMKGNLYYADPLILFDWCKNEISKNVALLHDYPLYEFTIVVKKEN